MFRPCLVHARCPCASVVRLQLWPRTMTRAFCSTCWKTRASWKTWQSLRKTEGVRLIVRDRTPAAKDPPTVKAGYECADALRGTRGMRRIRGLMLVSHMQDWLPGCSGTCWPWSNPTLMSSSMTVASTWVAAREVGDLLEVYMQAERTGLSYIPKERRMTCRLDTGTNTSAWRLKARTVANEGTCMTTSLHLRLMLYDLGYAIATSVLKGKDQKTVSGETHQRLTWSRLACLFRPSRCRRHFLARRAI